MFLRTWERELHFEPWRVIARATQQRALALIRQSRAFEFDEGERPEPPPGMFFRARFCELGRPSEAGLGDEDAGEEGDDDEGGDDDELEPDEDGEMEDDLVADARGDDWEDELNDGDRHGRPVTIEARFEGDDDDATARAEPTPVFTITHSTYTPLSLSATPTKSLLSPIIVKRSPVRAQK